jgi:hypothetical protein
VNNGFFYPAHSSALLCFLLTSSNFLGFILFYLAPSTQGTSDLVFPTHSANSNRNLQRYWINNMKYSPLEDKSDQDSRSSEEDGTQDSLLSSPHTPRKEYIPRKLVLLSSILIPTASLLFLGLGIWIGRKSVNANDICPVHVQHYCEFQSEMSMPTEECSN